MSMSPATYRCRMLVDHKLLSRYTTISATLAATMEHAVVRALDGAWIAVERVHDVAVLATECVPAGIEVVCDAHVTGMVIPVAYTDAVRPARMLPKHVSAAVGVCAVKSMFDGRVVVAAEHADGAVLKSVTAHAAPTGTRTLVLYGK